ncbi:MAG: hypothetical protein AAGA20_13445 [Planctomycetota bacterium]
MGCTVPPPEVQQGLDYGFRTPKQAFESWRTAVQGDLLDREYRCFSSDWRQRNGSGGRPVTLNTYALARDQVLEEYPYLRWAVYRAESPEEFGRTDDAALLVSRVPGPFWASDRYLLVRLRKQGFWELTVESAPDTPFGDHVSDPVADQVFYFDESTSRFFVIIETSEQVPGLDSAEPVDLATAGWEWKIDDFTIVDELPEDLPGAPPAP